MLAVPDSGEIAADLNAVAVRPRPG
jgi:hypothetical protein